MDKVRASAIRSRADIIEYNERNSKFFFSLEKANYNLKCIKCLNTSNGQITNEQDILKEECKFYKGLYSETQEITPEQKIEDKFLLNPAINKLSDAEKATCDVPLQINECSKALSNLKNNKAPGCDGFPVEFYKFFWNKIKNFVYNSYLFAFKKKELSYDQKRGIITLIPKKGKDLCSLKNWRPISLLNVDYKILTKALAARLQAILKNIINPDQVGYLAGRFIGENIRTTSDILSFCMSNKKSALITLIDFEKAFDSVRWSFLLKCLKAFNFGKSFMSWANIIYTNIESCVTNNGKSSHFFTLERGIRQGCCLSALLFIIVVEVLATSIRSSNSIKGIVIGDNEFKINQLADDTTLFTQDINSLKNALDLLDHFTLCSGLKTNKDKTEAIPINTIKSSDISLGIKWKEGNFKTLGIWFSTDEQEMSKVNCSEKISSIRKILNLWSCRNLTIFGKVIILKSLVISQIINLCSMIYIPEYFIKEVDEMCFEFLWGKGKRPKVKRNVVTKSIEMGGIKMINFRNLVTSLKAMWVKRLLLNENSEKLKAKWKDLSISSCKIEDKQLLLHKLSPIFKNQDIPLFYQQMLDSWFNFFSVKPETLQEILSEKIAHNKFILIGGSVIKSNQSILEKTGITRISDMCISSRLKSKEELEEEYDCKLSTIHYNSLISAIPTDWKKKLKKGRCPDSKNADIAHIGVNIANLNNKIIYESLTFKPAMPCAEMKWVEYYPILEMLDWKTVYSLPSMVTKNTKLYSLQFQVIHRYFGCNYNLHIWNITESPFCLYCKEIDTIEHYFYYCKELDIVWKRLRKISNVIADKT